MSSIYRKSFKFLQVCNVQGISRSRTGNVYSNQFKHVGYNFPVTGRIIIKVRTIQTSPPKNAIPPLFAILLRPILNVAAILFGRSIRKWWARLSPEEKQKVLNKLKDRASYITAGGTVLVSSFFLYYLAHVVEEPLTKRRRFIIYNEEQMKAISEFEFQNQVSVFRTDIVPPTHAVYKRVARVAMQLIHSNKDIKQVHTKSWTITVIDRPDITNAFVLPNGNIFVFTGMLNLCTNDDQLAIVMAHEMSHAILQHNAENLSKVLLLETLLLFPLVAFWIMFPDATALLSQWLSSKLADIMIHLPFSRFIEKEADMVGMQLAARSCFDIREAPVFWGKMQIVSQSNSASAAPIEWLSTHPSHESRQHELSLVLPTALKMREASACNALPPPTLAQRAYGKIS